MEAVKTEATPYDAVRAVLDKERYDAVREACGAPGVQDDLCTAACLGVMKRTWGACTDGQGTGDAQFADYSDKVRRVVSAAQNLEWRY